jgi:hypothetical protein
MAVRREYRVERERASPGQRVTEYLQMRSSHGVAPVLELGICPKEHPGMRVWRVLDIASSCFPHVCGPPQLRMVQRHPE